MANSRFRLLQVEPGHHRHQQRRLGHLPLSQLHESFRNGFYVFENPLDGLRSKELLLVYRDLVI